MVRAYQLFALVAMIFTCAYYLGSALLSLFYVLFIGVPAKTTQIATRPIHAGEPYYIEDTNGNPIEGPIASSSIEIDA